MKSHEVACLILLLLIVVSRIINVKAMKLLSQKEKANLLDKFTTHSVYSFVPLVVLFGLYYIFLKKTDFDKDLIFWVYIILLIVVMIIGQCVSMKKLSELDLPKEYVRMQTISRILVLLGVAILFATIIQGKA